MRDCPVCGSEERDVKWRQTFLVPEKWTQPSYLDWYVCFHCGMIYADNDTICQKDYDKYYQDKYGYGVEDMESRQRQQSRAQMVCTSIPNKKALIVDFGGVGIVSGYLRDYGFQNVCDISAGQALPQHIDCLLAEHVLEHIYDLPTAMNEISRNMNVGGLLIVDGPEAAGIAEKGTGPMLDWHQKHINHFSFFDYLHLMHNHGFEFAGGGGYIERGNPCMSMMFGRAVKDRIADVSLTHIHAGLEGILHKLQELEGREVVVWGCGDIALHSLSLHMPNVKYFVDKDPAFKGAKIAGRLVFDQVAKNEPAPILVLAQGQKQAILDNIRAEGLPNEVIVL